jgi:hypothetical protein
MNHPIPSTVRVDDLLCYLEDLRVSPKIWKNDDEDDVSNLI